VEYLMSGGPLWLVGAHADHERDGARLRPRAAQSA
jgi:hypothetical protein